MPLLLLILALLCSCRTAQYKVPFCNVVEIAKDNAATLLKSQGAVLDKEAKYYVLTEEAECVVNKQPAIISAKHNMRPILGYIEFIEGVAYITIVSDKGKINYDVLVHEFAHFWLIVNYQDYKHNPKYNDYFFNWKVSGETSDKGLTCGPECSTLEQ